jgi:hypothetical protein
VICVVRRRSVCAPGDRVLFDSRIESFSEANAAMPRLRIVLFAARSIIVRISNELLTVQADGR